MTLLAATQGLLERTYADPEGVGDLARFIIGDRGYQRVLRRREVAQVVRPVGVAHGDGARVLVSRHRGAYRLSIYYPDSLIARLEAVPPLRTLDERNIDPFADFIEEIDHFLALHHDLSHHRRVNLLALETRANISKALVVAHFLGRLAGRPRLRERERIWLRHHLFMKKRYRDPDPAVRQRYRDARRFALRMLARLEALPAADRIRELRRWNNQPATVRVRELAAAA